MRIWLVTLTLMISVYSALSQAQLAPERTELPSGDYVNKCQQCQIDGDILSCQCPRKLKKQPTTYFRQTLDMDLCQIWAAQLVVNRLACNDLYQAETEFELKDVPPSLPLIETDDTLPDGDYRYFCRQCKETESGELECSCKIDGWIFPSWYDTSLSLKTCPDTININYYRGYLFCNSEEMFKFMGSFSETCSECFLDGTNLNCLCRKTPCGWSIKDKSQKRHKIRSSLSYFRSCASEIINCNGTLRCGSCGTADFWDEVWRPHEGRSAMKSCDGIWR